MTSRQRENDTATTDRREMTDKTTKDDRIRNDEITKERRSDADKTLKENRSRNDEMTATRREVKNGTLNMILAISILILAVLTVGIFFV